MTKQNITQHEGKKYLRNVYSATIPNCYVEADVYEVLHAFEVNDQAVAHAIKKLLCAGQRGKGDRLADLKGAMAALNRAIDFAEREARGDHEPSKSY
jgi:hypothetical protein